MFITKHAMVIHSVLKVDNNLRAEDKNHLKLYEHLYEIFTLLTLDGNSVVDET